MLIEIKFQGAKGIEEGTVTKVHKKVGDEITSNDSLLSIEGNKKTAEVTINAEGKIEDLKVEEGDTIEIGDLIAVIDGEEVEAEEEKPAMDYFGDLMKPKQEEIEAQVTIIGSGPGGYVSAIKLAQLGADVVVVERDAIGGTCLNRGCIPTKALVKSAEVYKDIQEAEKFGCKVEDYDIDIKSVISRKDSIVSQLGGGIEHLLDKNNIRYVQGNGEILDKNTVFAKTKYRETTIKTDYIIIATGSTTSELPIPGIEHKNVLDSNEILEIDELPEEMVIIGGGVIGMEFAFIFNSFGTKVSLVEYMDRVLPNLDKDVSKEMKRIAKKRGIDIYTDSKVEKILEDEKDKCIVSFTQNGKEKYITTEKVLVSIGRQPYLEGLGLEEVGIELREDKKGIKIDDTLRTTVPNIFAIGDATGAMQLAHVASTQGIVAAKNIMGIEEKMDYNVVPSAIFTDPEVAAVGLDEDRAKEKGYDIEVGTFPMASNGKVLTLGVSEGFVKVIVDKKTKEILGASIVGPSATDLINEISIAMTNNLKVEDLTKTIHPHPTTSESIFEALLASEGACIHN